MKDVWEQLYAERPEKARDMRERSELLAVILSYIDAQPAVAVELLGAPSITQLKRGKLSQFSKERLQGIYKRLAAEIPIGAEAEIAPGAPEVSSANDTSGRKMIA